MYSSEVIFETMFPLGFIMTKFAGKSWIFPTFVPYMVVERGSIFIGSGAPMAPVSTT